MDFSKFQLERVFFFIAGIIPGFVALAVFQMSRPESFGKLAALPFPGYKAKLALLLLVAFVVGNSMTTLLLVVAKSAAPAIGRFLAEHSGRTGEAAIAPWRQSNWRVLVKAQLGPDSPSDTHFITAATFKFREDAIVNLPEDQRATAYRNLFNEKMTTDADDRTWESWYDHYHGLVLNPPDYSVERYVQNGLVFNLMTSAFYILIRMPFVPQLRHWWWVSFATVWCVIVIAVSDSWVRRLRDPWSTLSEQVAYLANLPKRY
jgi:hypothetical protein